MVTIPQSLQPPKRPKTQYQLYQSRLPKQQTPSKPISANRQDIEKYNKQLAQIKFENEARRLATRIMQGKKVSFYTNGQFNQSLADLTNKMVKGTGFFRRGARDVAKFIKQRDTLISSVEEDAQMTLTPELRREIILEAQRPGGIQYEIRPEGFNIVRETRLPNPQQQQQMSTPSISLLSQGSQMSIEPKQTRVNQAKQFFNTKKDLVVDKGKTFYDESNTVLGKYVTEPTIGTLFRQIDYTPGEDISATTKYLEKKGVPSSVARFGEGMAGAGLGILSDVKEKPAKYVATAGLGYGLSLGIGGFTSTAGAISPVVGSIARGTVIGVGGVLTGMYGLNVAKETVLAGTPQARGNVLGIAGAELTVLGFGMAKGRKGFQQITGLWRTKGRTYTPLKELTPPEVISGQKTFPTAPPSKHIGLFKQSKGAYHTTPSTFWKKGIIPEAGTSELPGLYGSSYISPHFAKLGGESSQYKFFGMSETGMPGVAFLEPKGFRVSSFKKVPPYKVGDQTFKYKFVKEPKPGVADIPKMKTEVEAVFRPGGEYSLTGKKTYTKIKGVRVPIDTFSFAGELTSDQLMGVTSSVKLRGGSSSYSLPGKSAIFTPQIGLGLSSSKTSSRILSGSSGIGSSSQKTSSSRRSSKISSAPSSVYSSVSSYSGSGGSSSRSPPSSSYSGSGGSSSRSPPSSPPSSFYFPGEMPPPMRKMPKQDRNRKAVPYIGYALKDSATPKRKAKWIKVTPRSTKRGALDSASEYTDKNIAATFKVVPQSKKIKGKDKFVQVETQKLNQASGYFERNRYKFREWKQKKGTRTHTPMKFRERQTYRLDKMGETRTIQAEKRVSASSLLFGGRNKSNKSKRGFRL